MTVRDWLEGRPQLPPDALRRQLLSDIGAAADADAAQAPAVFLRAAHDALARLLAGERFARDAALDLLAIDALMTYAYEYASETAGTPEALATLAREGAVRIGRLATADA